MRRISQISIAIFALVSVAWGGEGFGEVTVDQAEAKLKQKSAFFYDCNDPETYQSGHVPGAKLLDYPRATEKDFPADKKAVLIFYCMNEH